MFAVLIICATVLAQPDAKVHLQIYTLKHKSAADVEKMLADLLADLGTETGIFADTRANQILLRGPAEAHEIARQLIEKVDRPPVERPSTAKPVVKTYPCPKGRLRQTAARIRSLYSDRNDVRIATDPETERLLVLAPPVIHEAILRQLGSAEPAGANTATASGTSPRREERFIPLVKSQVDRVEGVLRNLFGPRLEPQLSREPGRSGYQLAAASGQRVALNGDRQRNGLTLTGNKSLVDQLERLIRTIDNSGQKPGTKVRLLPIRRADLAKVRQAVEAYRSGPRNDKTDPSRHQPPAEPRGAPALDRQGDDDHRTDQSRRFRRGEFSLVNYQTQAQPPQNAPREGAAGEPVDETQKGDVQPGRQRMRDLGSGIEIETLPDLDVIILRGRDRDVDEVTRIIEEIERLSAETIPAIEIYFLKHVRDEAVAELVDKINEALVGRRQGRVSITPLMKPNALLLIGWGEAVKAVKELIGKLDQPVRPETQLRVFRLRHAPATTAQTTVQQFFSGRAGLGPKVQVTADNRTNSLVVQAAPRDMQEVELLIRRLDTTDSKAVNQARIFKLKNSLAADLSSTLQAAINAARSGPGGGSAQKSAILELLTIDARGERVLKSGILDDVRITPDPRTNTLVVLAPAESMELLAALIEQLDGTPAAVAQIKVFRIVNGDANSLVNMLRSLLPSQTGAAVGPQLPGAEGETSLAPLRFSVDVRTNSIIATGSEGDLRIIEALLLRLDEKDVQLRKNTVYRLKNSPAIDVARAISEFLRSERQVQQAAPGAVSPFQQIESEVVVVPEPVSNALIISATPRFFEDIMDLVEQLDAQPPQVMIQVMIAEVKLSNTDEFGVELGLQDSLLFDRSLLGELVTTTSTSQQSTASGIVTATEEIIQAATNTPGFAFNNSPLGNSGSTRSLGTSNSTAGQALSNFAVGRTNNELGFGGLVLSASSESISVLVRALQESKRLEVLSRPQIMTLDNQPAFIQVGERVPRIIGTSINQTGQVNNIAMENVGLILMVTPRISPDGMVVMDLDAEKSDLGPEQEGIPVSVSAEGSVIRSPRVNITTAQTTVSAASGETIVLGGLITKNISDINRRVPWLADIPILGQIFQYNSLVTRRTELLIIMTPHVIRDEADAERLKQVETARMNWCSADVHEFHGNGELCTKSDCPICDSEIPAIYPDLNPRGQLPTESVTPQVPPAPGFLSPEFETPPAPPQIRHKKSFLPPIFPGRFSRDPLPSDSATSADKSNSSAGTESKSSKTRQTLFRVPYVDLDAKPGPRRLTPN